MQDFYIAWFLLKDINLEMVKFHRLNIKEELKAIYTFIKDLPIELRSENKGYEAFLRKAMVFKHKYQKDERKMKLSEPEKLELIRQQQNKSGISGAPIFLGDEFEIDHTFPMAIGGKDVIENLQVTHKDENRSKGSKA